MSEVHPEVLIIIPCYNPKIQTWIRLKDYLTTLQLNSKIPFEFLIVDDGSSHWVEPPSDFAFQLYRLPKNRGKGGAIKAGIALAGPKIKVIAFTDVDVPYSIESLQGVCSSVLLGRSDFCIGDRTFDRSYKTHSSFSRYLSHHLFRLFVRTIVAGGIPDTQSGVKAYRADIIKKIARLSQIDGFLFDLEWIYIALFYGFVIHRWPVSLQEHHQGSSLSFFGNRKLVNDFYLLVCNVLSQKYESDEIRELSRIDKKIIIEKISKN